MPTKLDGKSTPHEYIAPGGREYGIAAGILTGLNAQSKVLEIGCGFGETACNLAETFGCSVTAIDVNQHNIALVQEKIIRRNIGDLVSCIKSDLFGLEYPEGSFDLIAFEGGTLTASGNRKIMLDLTSRLLKPGGHLYITDLVVHSHASERIKQFYKKYRYASEKLYRETLGPAGFEILICTYLSDASWDNYMKMLRSMLDEAKGFFVLPQMREFAMGELDIYYNHDGRQGMDYIFILARSCN